MEKTLEQLARAIAASGMWAPREGQACRDDHGQWRYIGGQWFDECGVPCSVVSGADDDGSWESSEAHEAVRRGPDLTDDVTALSLLADMPEHGVWAGLDAGSLVWRCSDGSEHGCAASTRAEAIARAWLAHHGTNITAQEAPRSEK